MEKHKINHDITEEKMKERIKHSQALSVLFNLLS